MYPHFIEVHAHQLNDKLVSINIDHIIGFCGTSRGTGIITATDERIQQTETKESYDELKQLIEGAGALINKGDPRIDTEHRLTMEQIRKLLGEPVWNSNLGSWALVHYYDPDTDRIQLLNSAGKIYVMDEEELVRYPLYRMIGGER